jgi:putative transposase
MPVSALIIPLQSGKYYHVYNRGNNREKLFYCKEDYDIFMNKYHYYLGAFIDTYAYCLLPNHFHFLVRIHNDQNELALNVSNQFRKLFISYAKRVNTQKCRSGCLLTRNYRRVEINDEDYLRNLVLYIHNNPVKHGIVSNLIHYPYSTFNDFFLNKSSRIEKSEVLEWFGGWDNFLEQHRIVNQDVGIRNLISDD